jgi:hypothetical protein
MPEQVTVRIARAFSGPRHSRLELIWDCVAEYLQDRMVLDVTDNQVRKLSHAQIFQRMWEEEKDCPNRYVLFTEFDFLPDVDRALPLALLNVASRYKDSQYAAVGVQYATRHPETRVLRRHDGLAGGWWILIDKERAPRELLFAGTPDPGNQLPDQMPMILERGEDSWPFHFGIDYPFGTHLFWSRHYHDDPNMEVAGVLLGEMQQRHDNAVAMWLAAQPTDFRKLYMSRI